MKELRTLRAKTYSFLMNDDSEKKKAEGTKKAVIKRILMHKSYKENLYNHTKKQQRFKSNYHEMYTEEVNKVALSSDDDKRLPTFDRVKIFPPRTNSSKVCES